jgi:hypothetical protein
MYRFDAKLAFYFYPESSDNEDRNLWLNQGSSFEDDVTARKDICLTKHGLIIPQNVDSYEEFEVQIRINESRFLEILK